MKRLVLVILILTATLQGMAQRGFNNKGRKDVVAVGVKLGGSLARYSYFGQPALDTLDYDAFIKRVRPLVGVNVEFPIGGVLYVAPEVTLAGRGDARLFESHIWDTLVSYKAWVNYLEFRLPVSVAVPVSHWLKPYVFASPAFGLTLPLGKISQQSLDSTSFSHAVAIDSSNMALHDISLLLGAGTRFTIDFDRFSLVVKVEAGYHFGCLDTYSPMEHTDQAQAVNVNAYNIQGMRKNRGWEASITISLPLKFYRDACFYGSRIY